MIFKATFVSANANAGMIINKKDIKLGAKNFLQYKAIYKELSIYKFQSEIAGLKINPTIEFSLDEAKLIPAFDYESIITVVVSNTKAIEWVALGHAFAKTDASDEIEIKWHIDELAIKKYWADNGYKTNI